MVDSSVLIANLRGDQTAATRKLNDFADRELLLVGDIVMLEVLRGARDDRHATRIQHWLRGFDVAPLLSIDLAVAAARNYRELRRIGHTVRKTVDLIIGTHCIEHGHSLLHDDRDFVPMQEHLGLRVA